MLEKLTSKMESGTDLSVRDMNYAMDMLLSGSVPDEQKADFLQKLTKK